MKNEVLKKLIKEEIKKILSENPSRTQDSGTPRTQDSGTEKLSSSDFNRALTKLFIDLRSDKEGLSQTELQNLIDLFRLMEEFARKKNLTQYIEDRIKLVLDPQGKIQDTLDDTLDTPNG